MDDLGEGDAGAQTFTVEAKRVHAKLDRKPPPASHTRTAHACACFEKRKHAAGMRPPTLQLQFSSGVRALVALTRCHLS